ncbi:NEW3 domain-containing protein [Virgibacillus doumboii]|uniref:NEW3 domain-containing protein n=1 Tax=Virgibacillus doumboii TaxID=2697503 RepID=UPI0013E007A9|nr:NEW3 domain-containing protein [Virgibacillus doumboii]
MFRKILSILSLIVLLFSTIPLGNQSHAAGGVTLFTPYTGLSVTPGETITYQVDVMNSGSSIQNLTFSVEGLPKGWSKTITANGQDIQQLSVKPNGQQQITLEVTVPLEVKKDDYNFTLIADGDGDGYAELPFLTTVSEKGTFKTELTTEQPNMEGHADSTFTYTATINNRTAEKQNYALSSGAPKGWGVTFKADSKSVTSVSLEPNASKDITVEVTPPKNVKAETYQIPIAASAGDTSSKLNLEAVITGSYSIKLTTPSGKLSTDVSAGGEKVVDLVVKNNGTADLTDVSLSSSTPPDWDVKFDKSSIATIKAGDQAKVKATVTAPDDSIAGDYVTTFTAETAQVSSDANFRVSVETSTLWGFIGVLIILAVIGGLYYIFRKYGRR